MLEAFQGRGSREEGVGEAEADRGTREGSRVLEDAGFAAQCAERGVDNSVHNAGVDSVDTDAQQTTQWKATHEHNEGNGRAWSAGARTEAVGTEHTGGCEHARAIPGAQAMRAPSPKRSVVFASRSREVPRTCAGRNLQIQRKVF
jgi:hypothetical protein